MIDRVTQQTLFLRTLQDLRSVQGENLRAARQVTTGRRLERPSDDPTDAAIALRLGDRIREQERYAETATRAREHAEFAVTRYGDVTSILAEARSIALQGVNGATSSDGRAALALQVDALLDRALAVANERQDGRLLFGGTTLGASAFERVTSGSTTRFVYRGNDEARLVPVGPSETLDLGVPGSAAFGGAHRGATRIGGSTGLAAGLGIDTGRGRDVVEVRHTRTFFGDETFGNGGDSLSGLRPGTSSVDGDTVLGATGTHRITIDAIAGTIALDDGRPVAFTGTEADLALDNSSGERVHVDVRSIAAGFQGTVALRAEGTLSIDGGRTLVPLLYAGAQAVIDSETGALTHLDTRAVRGAGRAAVVYEGTSDLFTALRDLRVALRTADDGDGAGIGGQTLAEIVDTFDRLESELAVQSARLAGQAERALEFESRIEERTLALESLRETVEGVDLSEAITRLTQSQTALQMAQEVAARILQNVGSAFLL